MDAGAHSSTNDEDDDDDADDEVHVLSQARGELRRLHEQGAYSHLYTIHLAMRGQAQGSLARLQGPKKPRAYGRLLEPFLNPISVVSCMRLLTALSKQKAQNAGGGDVARFATDIFEHLSFHTGGNADMCSASANLRLLKRLFVSFHA